MEILGEKIEERRKRRRKEKKKKRSLRSRWGRKHLSVQHLPS